MEIVAIQIKEKVIFQLVDRTEDVQLKNVVTKTLFPEDTLWETPDRKFRHRPTQNTREYYISIDGAKWIVISEGIGQSRIERFLANQALRKKLFQNGFAFAGLEG